MASTVGYVGTIQVETVNVSRIFFGLTAKNNTSDWVKVGGKRAWFTMNLEAGDRPFYLAQLSLIKQAMSEGLQIKVGHEGAVTGWHYREPGDVFECNSARILRAPMQF
jgi:hypothetical protein